MLFHCQINIDDSYAQTPFHFCLADLVAVATSCVLLVDESQQEEIQLTMHPT